MSIRAAFWLGLLTCAAGPFCWGQAAAGPKAPHRVTTTMAFAGGKTISLEYGPVARPKGVVFGGAIPYDKVWAAGEGVATSITTQQEMRFAEGSIQRGKFSLYLMPSQKHWLLMVNQKTGQDASEFPVGFEYARFQLNHRTLPASAKPVERLTYTLKKLGPKRGRLMIAFDRTELWADFSEGNGQAHIHGEKEEDDD